MASVHRMFINSYILIYSLTIHLQKKKERGVDWYTPPNTPLFDFFHKTRDDLKPSSRRNGTRFYSEPPTGQQPTVIVLPSEAFYKRKRSHSSSSHESAKSDLEGPPGSNAPEDIPTLRTWLVDLQMDISIPYTRWDILREHFEAEASLDLKISTFSHLSTEELQRCYGIKMGDVLFFQEQLEMAGVRYGFGKHVRKAFQKKRKS